MGCPVPTPYFLQEVFLSAPLDPVHNSAVMAKILMSAEVTDRDRAFCEEVMGGPHYWWNAEKGPFPSFKDLTNQIDQRIQEVRNQLHRIRTYPT